MPPASEHDVLPQSLDLALPAAQVRAARLHALKEAECIELILEALDDHRGGWLMTVNLDNLRLLERDPDYARTCAQATLVVADGAPVVWASRLLGTPVPERVAGSNLISNLTAAAAARGRSIFLLGGSPGTAEEAAAALRERCADLNVAGTACPPMGFENLPGEMAKLTAALRSAQPDIVYVGLSKPKQEALIAHLRNEWPRCWFVGVGISFSFLAGEVRRAPYWMQRTGLEWLHRLAQQPRALAWRYLVQGFPYAFLVLVSAAIRGRRRAT
jgi:N-acetylglucosaminyldiphosphoundecaprenol N-acetyl-beta-D-mannosaminyltransferase